MSDKYTLIYLAVILAFACSFSNGYGQTVTSQIDKENVMEKSESQLFGKTGMIRAKQGSADELAGLLLHAAELVSDAEGCRLYIIGRDVSDENIIWVTEAWDSKEDHARSLELQPVRDLITKAMPLIESFPGGAETNILGGWGIGNEQ